MARNKNPNTLKVYKSGIAYLKPVLKEWGLEGELMFNVSADAESHTLTLTLVDSPVTAEE